jgi:hypothetical protein
MLVEVLRPQLGIGTALSVDEMLLRAHGHASRKNASNNGAEYIHSTFATSDFTAS